LKKTHKKEKRGKPKMTKQQKTLFLKFIEERKEYNNIYKPNKLYLNIAYYLIKNRLVKCNDLMDLYIVYDNLIINNEIIDKNNVNEYGKDTLERLSNLKHSTILKRLNNNKILLLNYYNKNDLISCCIWLDLNYNALDSELLNALK
jgi:hypothetical protein